MDLSLYHALNDFAFEHTLVGDLAKFFAQYAVFVVVAAIALIWLARGRNGGGADTRAAFAAGIATILALAIVQVIDHLYDRTRPFVHHSHHLLIAHGKDASFPSDHTSGAFAIAFTLLFFGRRALGWAALIAAALIAVARVMVGVHYPTDVLGGVLVGALAALIVWSVPVRELLAKLSDRLTALYARKPSRATSR
ncbi:MAG TPA: phosphatase PAP2 family protein [Solirubrobacteraceae bacterium]